MFHYYPNAKRLDPTPPESEPIREFATRAPLSSYPSSPSRCLGSTSTMREHGPMFLRIVFTLACQEHLINVFAGLRQAVTVHSMVTYVIRVFLTSFPRPTESFKPSSVLSNRQWVVGILGHFEAMCIIFFLSSIIALIPVLSSVATVAASYRTPLTREGLLQLPLTPGYDYDAILKPVSTLSALSSESFTVLTHPAFPRHSARIKKTDFCDHTVKYVQFILIVGQEPRCLILTSLWVPSDEAHTQATLTSRRNISSFGFLRAEGIQIRTM